MGAFWECVAGEDINTNGEVDDDEWNCDWNTHGQEYMLSAKINVETCTDGIHNGDESDIDCGGVCGLTCEEGKQCNVQDDCQEDLYCDEVCGPPPPTGRYLAIGNKHIIISDDGGDTWDISHKESGRTFLQDISCFEETCWVVGYGGLAFRSSNAGETWEKRDLGTSTRLNAVTFITPRRGWIVGSSGLIMKTIDGGETWIKISKTRATWNDIHCINEDECWIMGTGNNYAHTYDGGNDGWLLQDSGGNIINDVYFKNADEAFAVGSNDVALHGYFGGLAWTTQHLPTRDSYSTLNSVFFLNPTHGFMGGTRGAFFETIDGGGTWQKFGASNRDVLPNPENWNVEDIFFFNENEGCVSGYEGVRVGRMWCTKNGGINWHELRGRKRLYSEEHYSFLGEGKFGAITGIPNS